MGTKDRVEGAKTKLYLGLGLMHLLRDEDLMPYDDDPSSPSKIQQAFATLNTIYDNGYKRMTDEDLHEFPPRFSISVKRFFKLNNEPKPFLWSLW